MTWDWSAIDHDTDEVIITVGIVVLIVRQFLWRSADLHRMLRLPVLILVAGVVYLVSELRGEFRWALGDWFLLGELVLVAATGTVMGCVTHFRTHDRQLQYRLTASGLVLWVVFIGLRVGTFYLAAFFDTTLTDATGLILISFGANRLAAVLVVRRRARHLLHAAPSDLVKTTQ